MTLTLLNGDDVSKLKMEEAESEGEDVTSDESEAEEDGDVTSDARAQEVHEAVKMTPPEEHKTSPPYSPTASAPPKDTDRFQSPVAVHKLPPAMPQFDNDVSANDVTSDVSADVADDVTADDAADDVLRQVSSTSSHAYETLMKEEVASKPEEDGRDVTNSEEEVKVRSDTSYSSDSEGYTHLQVAREKTEEEDERGKFWVET